MRGFFMLLSSKLYILYIGKHSPLLILVSLHYRSSYKGINSLCKFMSYKLPLYNNKVRLSERRGKKYLNKCPDSLKLYYF